jgi:hypothetical protein
MICNRIWRRWLAAAVLALPLVAPADGAAQELAPASTESRGARRRPATPGPELAVELAPTLEPAPPERHVLAPGIEIVGAKANGVGEVRAVAVPPPEPINRPSPARVIAIPASQMEPGPSIAPEPHVSAPSTAEPPLASAPNILPPIAAVPLTPAPMAPATTASPPSGITTAGFSVAVPAPTPTVEVAKLPPLAPPPLEPKKAPTEASSPVTTAPTTATPIERSFGIEKHSFYLCLAAGANLLAQVFGGIFLMKRRAKRRKRRTAPVYD